VLLGLVLVSPFAQHTADDEPLTDAMVKAAKTEARSLAETEVQQAKLQGLKPEEKAALDKLQQDVKQAAKDLEKSQGKSARDVLSDLEKRANDAEKLANQLAATKDTWASDALVEQLRKHADTADLGDAVATKDAAGAATAAKALSEQLQQPQLSAEAQQRLAETLAAVAKAAEDGDSQRLVGGHVLGANEKLHAADVKGAGSEFQQLAETLARQAQREKAKEQLEALAQKLRDAGSRIAGQDGAMQQMQGAGDQQQAQQQGMQQGQQLGQGSMSQQQLQTPGLANQQAGQMMQQGQPPPSGEAGQSSQQLTLAQQAPSQQGDGKSDGKDDAKPKLFAPDPSKKPGEQPSTMLLTEGQPSNPNGPVVALPGSGLMPGQGANDKSNGDTTLQSKAKDSSVVNAQPNAQGPSSTRAVEGGIRSETATQVRKPSTAEFIQQQEAALDDAALPAARREQVRRYFQELRKRFEPAK
jgi:hypothetical protein